MNMYNSKTPKIHPGVSQFYNKEFSHMGRPEEEKEEILINLNQPQSFISDDSVNQSSTLQSLKKIDVKSLGWDVFGEDSEIKN